MLNSESYIPVYKDDKVVGFRILSHFDERMSLEPMNQRGEMIRLLWRYQRRAQWTDRTDGNFTPNVCMMPLLHDDDNM